MALGEPELTPVEIWQRRFRTFMWICLASIAHFMIFSFILVPFRTVGAPLSPVPCLLYWRLVSWLIQDEQFDLSITIKPENSRQLSSTIFTVLFLLNSMIWVYTLFAWYEPKVVH